MLPPIQTDADAPWKQRMRAPAIASAEIAGANEQRGLVISNRDSDMFQLYAWDVPTGALRRVTERPGGIFEAWVAADGDSFFYLEDEQGNELGHLRRVSADGEENEDVTPDLPPYTLRGVGLSRAGNLLALNPVNGDGFQLFCVTLGPDGALSPPRLIFRSEKEAWGATLSYDGELAAMISTARAGGVRHYSLLVFDTASGEQVGEVWDGPEASVTSVAFSPLPGDPRLLAKTTRSGYERPLIWNPRTDERIDLALPELEGEAIPLDWSPDASAILLCQISRARQQLYVYELASGTLRKVDHPEGTFYFPAIGTEFFGARFDGSGQIVSPWTDSTRPLRMVTLDPATGAISRELLALGDVAPGHAWRSITFPSSDGQEVQAWLGVPDGTGPFPTILETHGGPHFATPNWFDPASQAWLDHGFAFVTVNYRGSTTFGRDFREQIWGDLGHWEVEDMVAARAYLVEQGIAQPDAVFLTGGSYGGYLTLMGLSKYPDLWAGGMAYVAIADELTNYEDSSDALKAAVAGWFKGTPDEKREQYIASSPITYAEQVAAPVIVIQGRHDTRTTPRQMELYEAKMKSLGKEIEVIWFDAGHGGLSDEQVIEFQERLLKFAYHVLGADIPA